MVNWVLGVYNSKESGNIPFLWGFLSENPFHGVSWSEFKVCGGFESENFFRGVS